MCIRVWTVYVKYGRRIYIEPRENLDGDLRLVDVEVFLHGSFSYRAAT